MYAVNSRFVYGFPRGFGEQGYTSCFLCLCAKYSVPLLTNLSLIFDNKFQIVCVHFVIGRLGGPG